MRTNNLFRRLAAAVAAAALLTACGSGSYAANKSAATYEMTADAAAPSYESAAGSTGSSLMANGTDGVRVAETEQKIVYTVSLRMESTDFDGAAATLHAAAEDAGAYFENTNVGGSATEGTRYANYTVRVPVDHYSAFLAAAGKAGSVLSQSESADDITASYLDVTARLNALTAQRDRLNTLADSAETTADLLEIESQLSDVQYQIESYTSQKRYMDSQVSYSTVDISLDEVRTLTPVNETFGEQLASAFTGGLDAFAAFLRGLVLAIVFLAPLLACVVVVFLLVMLATRKTRAARKAARAARKSTPPNTPSTPDTTPSDTPIYKQ